MMYWQITDTDTIRDLQVDLSLVALYYNATAFTLRYLHKSAVRTHANK